MSAQQPAPATSGEPPLPGTIAADRADTVPEEIEGFLLGGPRRYNRVEAARAAGVSVQQARQIWLALGFADVGDDARVFTDSDVDALRAQAALVASGAITPDQEVPHIRAIGQSMARLADWQVREIMARIREAAGDDLDARAALAAKLTGTLLPVVEGLQSYTWRRHLAAAAARLLPAPPDELVIETRAVGFADIVGYTSTVRSTDISDLAALLEAFEEDAAEAIVSKGGRVVKSLGDEVLFVTESPRAAAGIALHLSDPDRAERKLPQLRVGLAFGRVLTRLGDVYGPTVNLAARLTSLARPGTVLVDREFAQALREDGEFLLRARRPAAVRGYHHLKSWVLTSRPG